MLEAFEMWVYKKILRIPWTDMVRNEEVLRRLNNERELITNIKKEKNRIAGPCHTE